MFVKSSLSISLILAMGFAYADNNMYVEGSAGVAIGASTNAKSQGTNSANHPSGGWDVDSKKGVVGLSLGYFIKPNIAIEGNYRYRENTTDGGQYLGSPKILGTTVNQDAKVNTHSLMVNGKYFFDIASSKIRPYAKAGIGIAQNKTDSTLDMTPLFSNLGAATLDRIGNGCKGSVKWCYPSDKKTNFAWSVGLGAQYPINEKTYVGLDYQYIDMGKAQTGIDPNGDRLEVKHVRNHEVSMTLGYRF